MNTYRRRIYMGLRHEEKPCFRCSKAEFEYGKFPLEISGKKYGEFDGYGCPNCGILFFTEESSKQIRAIISHLQMKINKVSLDGDISDIPVPSRAGSLDEW